MINDQNALTEIRDDWKSVRLKQNRIKVNTFSAIGKISLKFADLCYTLVLIYAFSVLHDVLRQMHQEGRFPCVGKNLQLGSLMQVSKDALPWVNFKQVDEGRERRNDVAHDDLVLPRKKTWEYIDAIEKELTNWHIIPDQGTDYSIPYGMRDTP